MKALKHVKEELRSISPLVVVFLFSLMTLGVVTIFHDQFYIILSAKSYLAIHNAVEIFSVIVAAMIFSLGWFTHRQSKNGRILFLGSVFLSVAILDFLHAMHFPGMPGVFVAGTTDFGIQFWIIARLVTAMGFFVGAFIPFSFGTRPVFKYAMLAAALALPVILLILVTFYPSLLFVFFVEGIGLTPLKVYSEYFIVGIFILAFVAHAYQYRQTKDRILVYYLATFILSIFGEIVFAKYRSAYDTYNLLGHIYKFFAFCFLYIGVFVISIKEPYTKLEEGDQRMHRSIRSLRLLSACNQALIHVTDERSFLQKICRILVKDGGYRLACVGRLDKEGKTIESVAQEGVQSEGCSSLLQASWKSLKEKEQSLGGAVLRSGKLIIVQDILVHPMCTSWKDDASKYGCAAVVMQPIIIDFTVVGLIVIFADKPQAFDDDEVALLKELANDLSYGMKVLRDAVQKKVSEEKLRENELLHSALVNAVGRAGIGMVILQNSHGREGAIVLANDRACLLSGYTKNELLGLTMKDVIAPSSLSLVASRYRERQSGSSVPDTYETEILHRNGSIVPVLISLASLIWNGKIATVVYVKDISEIRRAEEALRTSESHLKEAQRISRLGSWIWYPEKDTYILSDEVFEIFGYRHPFLMTTEVLKKLYTVDSFTVHQRVVALALKDGTPYSEELEFIRPDGSHGWLMYRGEPLKDASNRIVGLQGTVLDISREKILDRAKNEFLLLANHQLRTPLSATKWTLELFMQDKSLSKGQKERLKDLYAANQRSIDLVNDLLNTARVETGKMVANKRLVNVAELIQDFCHSNILMNAEKRHMKIEVSVSSKVKGAMIDELLFREALSNIITNAINYASEGSVISVKACVKDGMYVISVHNVGSVITENEGQSIFQKFFRGVDALTLETSGNGLGLFLAKGAVEANGGTIWYTSSTERGTTFFFSVPIA